MYTLLLLVGTIGFVAMTLLGVMHGSAHAHSGALSGHAPAGGHGPGPSIGGGHATPLAGHHSGGSAGHHAPAHAPSHPVSHGGSNLRARSFPAWLMISPLDVFSLAMGFGATGVLLKTHFAGTVLLWMAIVGALVFNLGIVKPVIGLMMKFVSKPSEGLEGILAKTADAVTRFDDSGRGLVKVTVDGQTVQLLATLEDAEIHRGVQVNKGDEVVVIEVDSAKNTCRVSKEL